MQIGAPLTPCADKTVTGQRRMSFKLPSGTPRPLSVPLRAAGDPPLPCPTHPTGMAVCTAFAGVTPRGVAGVKC